MKVRTRNCCPRPEQLEGRSLLSGFLTWDGILTGTGMSYSDPTAPLGSVTNPVYIGLVNGGVVTPTTPGPYEILTPGAVGAAGFSYPDPTAPLGSATNPVYGGLVNGGAFPPTQGGSDPIAIPVAVGAAGFSYPDPTAPLGSATNPVYLGLVNGGAVPPTPGTSDAIAIPGAAGAGQASGGTPLALNTPAARYVDQLFIADLGRAPTPSNLTFWTAVIHRYGAGHAAREIAGSPEAKMYRLDLASGIPGSATNPIYLGLVNGGAGTPTPGGPDQIVTPEAAGAGKASGNTPLALNTPAARYVDQLFMADLGRAPTQSDLTFWTAVVHRYGAGYAALKIAASPQATS